MPITIFNKGWLNQFTVFCNDIHIINEIATLCGQDVSQTALTDNRETVITVSAAGDHYVVCHNGKTVVTESPVQAVKNIIFEETVYDPTLFPLHGGAIEAGGTAHLFLAPTHAGKTTLTAYLTHRGYPYINDDCILIDMDALSVLPNAEPIHLRPESIPILNKHGCFINGSEINIENIHRIAFLPSNSVTAAMPVGSIFFIERSAGENYCKNIPKDDAVRLLTASLISPKAADIRRLKCAIKLASKCKKLVYSDMRYVSDLLEKEAVL